jgi:hypothetical protein
MLVLRVTTVFSKGRADPQENLILMDGGAYHACDRSVIANWEDQ